MSAEDDALRERVAELEAELAETARRANAAVARAEARAERAERWAVRLAALRSLPRRLLP